MLTYKDMTEEERKRWCGLIQKTPDALALLAVGLEHERNALLKAGEALLALVGDESMGDQERAWTKMVKAVEAAGGKT